MQIQQNMDGIQTTHVGTLPRPRRLRDLMQRKYSGAPCDEERYQQVLRHAVADVVREQVGCGIDIVSDGEFSKPGLFTYFSERLKGFERRPRAESNRSQHEIATVPEPHEDYANRTETGAARVSAPQLVCVGPVEYRGDKLVAADIANVKAAAAAAGVGNEHVFLVAPGPSGPIENAYYTSDEEYLHALAAELNKEYRAIIDAGLLVQIDDPFLEGIFLSPNLDAAQKLRRAEICVEATNAALQGIPPEYVRLNAHHGIEEGRRIAEAPFADIVPYLLRIEAGSYCFDAANPRHEYDYRLFERIKIPNGKVLVPAVIARAGNIVEPREIIAERIIRFARLVGRESVIAGADCSAAILSLEASTSADVRPAAVWEKFKAMRAGADLATEQLWG
jgi:5-methyltetrahydropteroyltriglutamate--homocysteine methyltransferase